MAHALILCWPWELATRSSLSLQHAFKLLLISKNRRYYCTLFWASNRHNMLSREYTTLLGAVSSVQRKILEVHNCDWLSWSRAQYAAATGGWTRICFIKRRISRSFTLSSIVWRLRAMLLRASGCGIRAFDDETGDFVLDVHSSLIRSLFAGSAS